MTEKSKYVIEEPRDQIYRDGMMIFNGLRVDPKAMGEDCQLLYSIVTKAHVNEETPHIHDFPIITTFAGINPDDVFDFDAEIEFDVGDEKIVMTKASTVVVPAGVPHCPLVFKRVGKPIAFIEVHLTDEYVRRAVE